MNFIKNMFKPNEYIQGIFIRVLALIKAHKEIICISSILFVPVMLLLCIWYCVSLFDDLADFIWFKYLDICIIMSTIALINKIEKV